MTEFGRPDQRIIDAEEKAQEMQQPDDNTYRLVPAKEFEQLQERIRKLELRDQDNRNDQATKKPRNNETPECPDQIPDGPPDNVYFQCDKGEQIIGFHTSPNKRNHFVQTDKRVVFVYFDALYGMDPWFSVLYEGETDLVAVTDEHVVIFHASGITHRQDVFALSPFRLVSSKNIYAKLPRAVCASSSDVFVSFDITPDTHVVRRLDIGSGKTRNEWNTPVLLNNLQVTPDGQHLVGSSGTNLWFCECNDLQNKHTLVDSHMDSLKVEFLGITANGKHVFCGSGRHDTISFVSHFFNGVLQSSSSSSLYNWVALCSLPSAVCAVYSDSDMFLHSDRAGFCGSSKRIVDRDTVQFSRLPKFIDAISTGDLALVFDNYVRMFKLPEDKRKLVMPEPAPKKPIDATETKSTKKIDAPEPAPEPVKAKAAEEEENEEDRAAEEEEEDKALYELIVDLAKEKNEEEDELLDEAAGGSNRLHVCSAERVAYYMKWGENPRAKNTRGRTPLMHAFFGMNDNYPEYDAKRAVELLKRDKEFWKDLHLKDKSGESILGAEEDENPYRYMAELLYQMLIDAKVISV